MIRWIVLNALTCFSLVGGLICHTECPLASCFIEIGHHQQFLCWSVVRLSAISSCAGYFRLDEQDQYYVALNRHRE